MDFIGKEYYEHCKNDRGCDFFVKGAWQKMFVDMLFSLKLKMDSILDVGCAAGALASTMADKGSNVVGCDLAQWMIENSPYNKKNGGNVELHSVSATELKKVPGEYDFILCTEVVGHVPPKDSFKIAKGLASKLKKNGVLWLSYENSYQDNMKACGPLDDKDDVTHINRRSPAYWIDQLSKTGLKRLEYMEELNKEMEFYKLYNWDILIYQK